MSRHQVSRRAFFGASMALGVAAPTLLSARSPSEKLAVAIIGAGGRGGAQLEAAGSLETVVAVCDVDDRVLSAARQKYPRAKTYCDFRAMLSEMEGSIDAVMVSTPDHTHAPASAMAMRMGKHCYCEKPLTHTVSEARCLTQLARQKNLVTQMGTQIHAGDNYRRVVELIRAGTIGPIREVIVWCDKNWGGGHRPVNEDPSVPPYLHWAEWLGPASARTYHPVYLPGKWRRFWDFGSGTLGDMACHIMDVVFWALDLRYPKTIAAEGPPVDAEGCGANLKVTYEFPARGSLPPVKVTWHDGDNRPTLPSAGKEPGGIGALFIGNEGMLRVDYNSRTLYPQEQFRDFKAPAPSIPNSIGHHKEFFEACKSGTPTTCNFDYSGALTEAVLLGAVAYRLGKQLDWDAVNLRAVNSPEADALIWPQYANSWTL